MIRGAGAVGDDQAGAEDGRADVAAGIVRQQQHDDHAGDRGEAGAEMQEASQQRTPRWDLFWILSRVRHRIIPPDRPRRSNLDLSLIHISEPTRLGMISYAVF